MEFTCKLGEQFRAGCSPGQPGGILFQAKIHGTPTEFTARRGFHQATVQGGEKVVFEGLTKTVRFLSRKKIVAGEIERTKAKDVQIRPIVSTFMQERITKEIRESGVGRKILIGKNLGTIDDGVGVQDHGSTGNVLDFVIHV